METAYNEVCQRGSSGSWSHLERPNGSAPFASPRRLSLNTMVASGKHATSFRHRPNQSRAATDHPGKAPRLARPVVPAYRQRLGEGDLIMKAKRTKEVTAPAPAPLEITASDRERLIAAYQAGVITAWKRDADRGYRLTIPGRPDDYVEVAKLTKYLEKLGGAA